jgi:hypothetical protein
MNLHRLATRSLALLFNLRRCHDGPMQGAALVLTENSPNTAWIEVNGCIGRYVADKNGKLVWQPR